MEENGESLHLSDVDIIVTIRSGHTDLKSLQTLLERLISSSKFQSTGFEIVMTESEITLKSTPGKKLTSLITSFRIE